MQSQDSVETILQSTNFLELNDWHFRWLSGLEYYEMLTNIQYYSNKFQFSTYTNHPIRIYFHPMNGWIYFLKKTSLRRLGFPRLQDNNKKTYKWKKMNFQTLLPKSKPKVSYIVCSTSGGQDNYRMHIVQLYSKENKDQPQYLLCHMLQMELKGCPHYGNYKVERPLYFVSRKIWLSQQQRQVPENNEEYEPNPSSQIFETDNTAQRYKSDHLEYVRQPLQDQLESQNLENTFLYNEPILDQYDQKIILFNSMDDDTLYLQQKFEQMYDIELREQLNHVQQFHNHYETKKQSLVDFNYQFQGHKGWQI